MLWHVTRSSISSGMPVNADHLWNLATAGVPRAPGRGKLWPCRRQVMRSRRSSSPQLIVQLLLLPEQHEMVTGGKEGGCRGRPRNYCSFLTSSTSHTEGRFGPPVTFSSKVTTSSSTTRVPETSASDTPGANSITNLEQNLLVLPK